MIYKITNIINDKIYIGKTRMNLTCRLKGHEYSSKYGSGTFIHRAIRKCGISNFKIELLEETLKDNEREKYWIDTLTPDYNLTKGGDGGDTSKTPNYIKSMRKLNRKGVNNPMFGKLGILNPNFGQKRGKSLKIRLVLG